jgi:hypothetical protein
MSPGEVKSLQQLAMAHGGSLSVNPSTGLPEAGFLQNLLPAIVGAGLVASGVGAPMAALMVGGGYGLASGSLSKGLMAGLGAYGGAGMAEALMQGGASATAAGISEANATQAAQQAAQAAPGVTVGGPMSTALPQGTPLNTLSPMSSGSAGMDTMLGVDGMGGGVAATPAPSVPTAAPASMPPIDRAQMGSVFEGNENIKQLPKTFGDRLSAMGRGFTSDNIANYVKDNKLATAAIFAPSLMEQPASPEVKGSGPNPYNYRYEPNVSTPFPVPDVPGYGDQGRNFGREQRYYSGRYVPLASGGPVEQMSNANAIGTNTGFPMADMHTAAYATPYQTPVSQNVLSGTEETNVDPYTGQERLASGGKISLQGTFDVGGGGDNQQFGQSGAPGYQAVGSGGGNNALTPDSILANAQQYGLDPRAIQANPQQAYAMAQQAIQREQWMPGSTFLGQAAAPMAPAMQIQPGMSLPPGLAGALASMRFAKGGLSDLGGYSDGGRLLRGPGDGVSDSIPATIGNKQPARLADGEFVVPARIVSELGNGSTEAGARQLYAMMDRVQKARGKTVGKGRVAKNTRANKYLPA